MSFSARNFYYHNQPSTPSWAKTRENNYGFADNKSGRNNDRFYDWFSDKLDSGLFDQTFREDPIDPTEPTEAPAGETYVEFPHPVSSGGVVGKSVNNTIEFADKVEKSIAKALNSSTIPDTSSSGSSAKPVIYSEWSPVSKLFGMNQETAFGEHMANTAHQREVADLKAAGLNPVLGVSGSGATSVSGYTGASSSAEKIQDEDNKLLDVLGATAAVITSVATKNPMYGYMISNVFKAFK